MEICYIKQRAKAFPATQDMLWPCNSTLVGLHPMWLFLSASHGCGGAGFGA